MGLAFITKDGLKHGGKYENRDWMGFMKLNQSDLDSHSHSIDRHSDGRTGYPVAVALCTVCRQFIIDASDVILKYNFIYLLPMISWQ